MISVNIDKAKVIGHDIRRARREQEFQPLDEQIAKQIPGVDVDALESARQAIRDRYARIQVQIEAAKTPEEIRMAFMA